MKSQHEFAIYFPALTALLSDAVAQESLKIQDADLAHRVERVLRLQASDEFILFDQRNHARCRLGQFENRRTVEVLLLEVGPNQVHAPELTLWLPVLKRDDLEEALYAAVELGVNSINLLMTEKVQRSWGGEKEFERLQRIIIAAAEQSKNFAFPHLQEPIRFEAFLHSDSADSALIFFDPAGKPLLETLQTLHAACVSRVDALIGPEGDLTEAEKLQLKSQGAIFCALTPTVLRARQAVAVGIGAIRSAIQ